MKWRNTGGKKKTSQENWRKDKKKQIKENRRKEKNEGKMLKVKKKR